MSAKRSRQPKPREPKPHERKPREKDPEHILQVGVEGAGLRPRDVPIRQLLEMLEALVGALDAVAKEAGIDPAEMRLVAVREGSANYQIWSASPSAPEVVDRFYIAAKDRGKESTTPVRRAFTRLHAAVRVGALRLTPRGHRKRASIFLAQPIQDEPLAIEEAAEVLVRVVGLTLAQGGGAIVKLRADDARGAIDAHASEEMARLAAKYFGETVRARVLHEHRGESRSTQLESIAEWRDDDLVAVMRQVRDELAAEGVRINAAEWLAELE